MRTDWGSAHIGIPFQLKRYTNMEMILDNDTWLEDQRLMDGVLADFPMLSSGCTSAIEWS